MRTWSRVVVPLLTFGVLLAAWHVAVTKTGTKVMPSPRAVWLGLRELDAKGVLLRHILSSLRRVGLGYAIAVVLGVPLGVAMGRSRIAHATFDPIVQLLRPLSPIAWLPVAVVLFGLGERAPIFLVSLAAVLPIAAATAGAVRRVPIVYLRVGENLGLSGLALTRRVVLPASLPEIVGALRLALGVAWLVVVAAEMLATDAGLGYLIIDARNAGKRYDLVVAGMLLVGAIGLLLDVCLRALERLPALRTPDSWGTVTATAEVVAVPERPV